MQSIIIPFTSNELGRVEFYAHVMTGNRKSLKKVDFKLDSGSDFTTISCRDLIRLGYSQEYLESCPFHETGATLAADDHKTTLQYIPNVSIKFGDRELQQCRVFFALGTKLRSLFGSDILKYFNREIDYDTGVLTLKERKNKPKLATGEVQIQIYSLEQA
jgi:hypothetical protein